MLCASKCAPRFRKSLLCSAALRAAFGSPRQTALGVSHSKRLQKIVGSPATRRKFCPAQTGRFPAPMITVMRKHHKWLMIVIAILAIPFVFYFNKTDVTARRQSDLGRIYDRPITIVEFQRSYRLLGLAQMLGLSQLVQDLMMRPMSNDEAYVNFAFNRLVLDHEARALGVRPTSAEIVAFVKTLAPFQGTNGFDANKYTEFTQNRLPAMGFTDAQIEELVSDQLALNRLKDLLGTGLHVADSESTEYYNQAYGKLHVALVRI